MSMSSASNLSTSPSTSVRLGSLLFRTPHEVALTVTRVGLGAVMLPHGAQKALGWFGGMGFSQTMGMFTSKMGIPPLLALLAIAAEFLGALGLVTGFFTRIAAFGVFCTMFVAMMVGAVHNGFFMNWFGNQKGEGMEYFLLVFALAIPLIIRGGGAFSVDRLLSRRA